MSGLRAPVLAITRLRVPVVVLLALGALLLGAGCQVVSAQGVPDAGAGARIDRARRALDGGVHATAADEEDDENSPDRVPEVRRARSDGGVRRARSDGGVRPARADGGVRQARSDGGVRQARADGGVRRARSDGGVRPAPRDGDVRGRARDAVTSTGAGVDGEAIDAASSVDGGLAMEAVPSEPSTGDTSPPSAALADAGTESTPPDTLSLDASAAPDGGVLLADAAPDALDAATMTDDAGASTAPLLDATLALDAGALLPPVVADAGTASAASPATPTFDPWELLARLAGGASNDDDDHERAPSAPSITPLPDIDDAMWDRLETLVPALPSGRASMFALLLLLAIAVVIVRALGRARRVLPDRGVIPRVLAIAHGLARLTVAALVLALVAELLPDWARSALPWVVVAGAVALGWSARDLLPDLVAGAVLLTERRVSRGQHLVVAEHEGVVTDVGLRVTTLRDTSGRELRVPNRIVLSSPTTTRRSAWHAITVRVRAPEGVAPDAFARALREAVLLSPWIPVPVVAEIARDPDEPCTFEVRTTLLDLRFETRFRGELLGRAEAVLASASDEPRSS